MMSGRRICAIFIVMLNVKLNHQNTGRIVQNKENTTWLKNFVLWQKGEHWCIMEHWFMIY